MNFVETPIVIGIVINDSSNSSESYMKELQKLKESKESRYFFFSAEYSHHGQNNSSAIKRFDFALTFVLLRDL